MAPINSITLYVHMMIYLFLIKKTLTITEKILNQLMKLILFNLILIKVENVT